MCGTSCIAYYTTKELANPDFSSNVMKRSHYGRKHFIQWTFLPDVSKCWQGTETTASCTAHHFNFLVNDVRCGVWLVWHRNRKSLTLQRVGIEHNCRRLPWWTCSQELMQVFEIYSLSIIKKKKNAYIVGKHWCPHRKNFSETPRKSVTLAPFCKDRRGGFKYMNWWGTLLSAVRLHNVQLPLKTVWSGVEKVMPDLCPGLNFYFCARLMDFNVKIWILISIICSYVSPNVFIKAEILKMVIMIANDVRCSSLPERCQVRSSRTCFVWLVFRL